MSRLHLYRALSDIEHCTIIASLICRIVFLSNDGILVLQMQQASVGKCCHNVHAPDNTEVDQRHHRYRPIQVLQQEAPHVPLWDANCQAAVWSHTGADLPADAACCA